MLLIVSVDQNGMGEEGPAACLGKRDKNIKEKVASPYGFKPWTVVGR